MRSDITRRTFAGMAAAAAADILLPGCASPVPGAGNGLTAISGKSLSVTLTYRLPVIGNYWYIFCINNTNNPNGAGPIPVGAPISGTPYGNGFATGSDTVSAGFTDFVVFTSLVQPYTGAQPVAGFGLYHVMDGKDGNNPQNFVFNGVPIQYLSPLPNASTSISFEIDLAQLFTYPNSPYSQATAVNKAQNLMFVQVNAISTNYVTVETGTTLPKEFDSFGDDSDGQGQYQTVDLTQQDYGSGLSLGIPEPENDVFISPRGTQLPQDGALDLVQWVIQIGTTNTSRAVKGRQHA